MLKGRPVERSHASTVSPWLAKPTAATPPPDRAIAVAAGTEDRFPELFRVLFDASARDRSRGHRRPPRRPGSSPSSSNTTAFVAEVPWSTARILTRTVGAGSRETSGNSSRGNPGAIPRSTQPRRRRSSGLGSTPMDHTLAASSARRAHRAATIPVTATRSLAMVPAIPDAALVPGAAGQGGSGVPEGVVRGGRTSRPGRASRLDADAPTSATGRAGLQAGAQSFLVGLLQLRHQLLHHLHPGRLLHHLLQRVERRRSGRHRLGLAHPGLPRSLYRPLPVRAGVGLPDLGWHLLVGLQTGWRRRPGTTRDGST